MAGKKASRVEGLVVQDSQAAASEQSKKMSVLLSEIATNAELSELRRILDRLSARNQSEKTPEMVKNVLGPIIDSLGQFYQAMTQARGAAFIDDQPESLSSLQLNELNTQLSSIVDNMAAFFSFARNVREGQNAQLNAVIDKPRGALAWIVLALRVIEQWFVDLGWLPQERKSKRLQTRTRRLLERSVSSAETEQVYQLDTAAIKAEKNKLNEVQEAAVSLHKKLSAQQLLPAATLTQLTKKNDELLQLLQQELIAEEVLTRLTDENNRLRQERDEKLRLQTLFPRLLTNYYSTSSEVERNHIEFSYQDALRKNLTKCLETLTLQQTEQVYVAIKAKTEVERESLLDDENQLSAKLLTGSRHLFIEHLLDYSNVREKLKELVRIEELCATSHCTEDTALEAALAQVGVILPGSKPNLTDRFANLIPVLSREARFHFFFEQKSLAQVLDCHDEKNELESLLDLATRALNWQSISTAEITRIEELNSIEKLHVRLYRLTVFCQELQSNEDFLSAFLGDKFKTKLLQALTGKVERLDQIVFRDASFADQLQSAAELLDLRKEDGSEYAVPQYDQLLRAEIESRRCTEISSLGIVIESYGKCVKTGLVEILPLLKEEAETDWQMKWCWAIKLLQYGDSWREKKPSDAEAAVLAKLRSLGEASFKENCSSLWNKKDKASDKGLVIPSEKMPSSIQEFVKKLLDSRSLTWSQRLVNLAFLVNQVKVDISTTDFSELIQALGGLDFEYTKSGTVLCRLICGELENRHSLTDVKNLNDEVIAVFHQVPNLHNDLEIINYLFLQVMSRDKKNKELQELKAYIETYSSTTEPKDRLLLLLGLRKNVEGIPSSLHNDTSRVLQVEIDACKRHLFDEADFSNQLRSHQELLEPVNALGYQLKTKAQLLQNKVKQIDQINYAELAELIKTYEAYQQTKLINIVELLRSEPADPRDKWMWIAGIQTQLSALELLDLGEQAVCEKIKSFAIETVVSCQFSLFSESISFVEKLKTRDWVEENKLDAPLCDNLLLTELSKGTDLSVVFKAYRDYAAQPLQQAMDFFMELLPSRDEQVTWRFAIQLQILCEKSLQAEVVLSGQQMALQKIKCEADKKLAENIHQFYNSKQRRDYQGLIAPDIPDSKTIDSFVASLLFSPELKLSYRLRNLTLLAGQVALDVTQVTLGSLIQALGDADFKVTGSDPHLPVWRLITLKEITTDSSLEAIANLNNALISMVPDLAKPIESDGLLRKLQAAVFMLHFNDASEDEIGEFSSVLSADSVEDKLLVSVELRHRIENKKFSHLNEYLSAELINVLTTEIATHFKKLFVESSFSDQLASYSKLAQPLAVYSYQLPPVQALLQTAVIQDTQEKTFAAYAAMIKAYLSVNPETPLAGLLPYMENQDSTDLKKDISWLTGLIEFVVNLSGQPLGLGEKALLEKIKCSIDRQLNNNQFYPAACVEFNTCVQLFVSRDVNQLAQFMRLAVQFAQFFSREDFQSFCEINQVPALQLTFIELAQTLNKKPEDLSIELITISGFLQDFDAQREQINLSVPLPDSVSEMINLLDDSRRGLCEEIIKLVSKTATASTDQDLSQFSNLLVDTESFKAIDLILQCDDLSDPVRKLKLLILIKLYLNNGNNHFLAQFKELARWYVVDCVSELTAGSDLTSEKRKSLFSHYQWFCQEIVAFIPQQPQFLSGFIAKKNEIERLFQSSSISQGLAALSQLGIKPSYEGKNAFFRALAFINNALHLRGEVVASMDCYSLLVGQAPMQQFVVLLEHQQPMMSMELIKFFNPEVIKEFRDSLLNEITRLRQELFPQQSVSQQWRSIVELSKRLDFTELADFMPNPSPDPAMAWRWALVFKSKWDYFKTFAVSQVAKQAVLQQVDVLATQMIVNFKNAAVPSNKNGLVMPTGIVDDLVAFFQAMLHSPELSFQQRLHNLHILAKQVDVPVRGALFNQLLGEYKVEESGHHLLLDLLIGQLGSCQTVGSVLETVRVFCQEFTDLSPHIKKHLANIAVTEDQPASALLMVLRVQLGLSLIKQELDVFGGELNFFEEHMRDRLCHLISQEEEKLINQLFSNHARLDESLQCLQLICTELPSQYDDFYAKVKLPDSLLCLLRSEIEVIENTQTSLAQWAKSIQLLLTANNLIRSKLDSVSLGEDSDVHEKVGGLIETIRQENEGVEKRLSASFLIKINAMSDDQLKQFVHMTYEAGLDAWFPWVRKNWQGDNNRNLVKLQLLWLKEQYLMSKNYDEVSFVDQLQQLGEPFKYQPEEEDNAASYNWFQEEILKPVVDRFFFILESRKEGINKKLIKLKQDTLHDKKTAHSPFQYDDFWILHAITDDERNELINSLSSNQKKLLSWTLSMDCEGCFIAKNKNIDLEMQDLVKQFKPIGISPANLKENLYKLLKIIEGYGECYDYFRNSNRSSKEKCSSKLDKVYKAYTILLCQLIYKLLVALNHPKHDRLRVLFTQCGGQVQSWMNLLQKMGQSPDEVNWNTYAGFFREMTPLVAPFDVSPLLEMASMFDKLAYRNQKVDDAIKSKKDEIKKLLSFDHPELKGLNEEIKNLRASKLKDDVVNTAKTVATSVLNLFRKDKQEVTAVLDKSKELQLKNELNRLSNTKSLQQEEIKKRLESEQKKLIEEQKQLQRTWVNSAKESVIKFFQIDKQSIDLLSQSPERLERSEIWLDIEFLERLFDIQCKTEIADMRDMACLGSRTEVLRRCLSSEFTFVLFKEKLFSCFRYILGRDEHKLREVESVYLLLGGQGSHASDAVRILKEDIAVASLALSLKNVLIEKIWTPEEQYLAGYLAGQSFNYLFNMKSPYSQDGFEYWTKGFDLARNPQAFLDEMEKVKISETSAHPMPARLLEGGGAKADNRGVEDTAGVAATMSFQSE